MRRRPALAAQLLVSGVVALTLVAGGVGLFFSKRLKDANGQLEAAVQDAEGQCAAAIHQQGEAEKQRGRAERQQALARRYLNFSRINMADSTWREVQAGRMRELLEEQRPNHPNQKDFRGFEWHYLWPLSHSSLLTLKGHANCVNSVAFSSDSKRLASASEGGTVKVWDATPPRNAPSDEVGPAEC